MVQSRPISGDGVSNTVADAMPVEMTEKTRARTDESNPVDAPPAIGRASGEHEARQSVSPPPDQRPSRRRRLLIAALCILVVAVVGIFGIPWIVASLNTVSTDDAYVNGHVTFVAPRVAGQISQVLVDDNNRVHKGELLAELDKQPFEDAVAVKRAAVDTAAANLRAAQAAVRDIEAQAWARRWGLQNAVQDVDDKIALLHARVAALDKSRGRVDARPSRFLSGAAVAGDPGRKPSGVRPGAKNSIYRQRTSHRIAGRSLPGSSLFGTAGATGWRQRS